MTSTVNTKMLEFKRRAEQAEARLTNSGGSHNNNRGRGAYNSNGRGRGGGGQGSNSSNQGAGQKKPCRFFNKAEGCKFSAAECHQPHK